MARLYANFAAGIISTAISPTDTSVSSPRFTRIPAVVAPDWVALTLDPDETEGDAEIVHVTDHADGSTTCIISRGQEGTTARAHSAAMTWRASATAADFTFAGDLAGDPQHATVASIAGVPVAGTPAAGQTLVGQGDGSALWDDPDPQNTEDISVLQAEMSDALAETFASRPDVKTPGPAVPLDGGIYATRRGAVRLIPRSTYLDNTKYANWLAGADDDLPLAMGRHSIPQGTQNAAYTSTVFTAVHGFQFDRITWSVTTAGDAVPAGMTFTDNGDNTATLAGTPTGSGSYNLIVQAVDALGGIAQETYTLVVAATGGSFAFALPAFADFHVGDTVSHALAGDCTNPAGALSFTTYSSPPITGVTASASFNTFTKSGLTVANDTVVAFQGLTNIGGITNDTSYWVVNTTAGTGFQVASSKGGAVIDLTGTDDTADITIQFPTLPNHHLTLSGSTLQTSTAFTTADIGTIPFWITAYDTATHISSRGTIKVLAVTGGPTITTTTVPAGTQNAAYTTTTFAATDTDVGAAPLVWSLDATSDALPTGMTFTGGVLAGTPTVFGTYHLVMKVVDHNGASDTQAVTLTVAQAAGSFAFNLPASLPDATAGTDYLYDASTVCTNPAGALTFDSYSNAPVTSVAMNNAGDTLTWSGQVASIANGTVVALAGVTGTPGVLNGPTNTYFVVGSGTRSVQLATTLGGSAIAFTGDETGLTIQFPSLPNQHFSLDPATGHVTALGAQIANNVSFWIRAYDTATHIAKQTTISVTASGTTLDIATIGLVTGDLSALTRANQVTTATANASKLNTAAEQMRTLNPQGTLTSSLARGTVINLYNATAGGRLISSGSSGNPGLDKWHLNGAVLRALDLLPLFPENGATVNGNHGTWYSGNVFGLFYAKHPELDFTIDANGAGQYQVDMTRTAAQGTRAGYSSHGASIWYCGPIKFGNGAANPFTVKNCRALTGSSLSGITINGTKVWTTECFHIENHRNVGGDTGYILVTTDDGLTSDTGVDARASGYKSHYQMGDINGYHAIQCVIQADNTRHGIGCYRGGLVTCLAGSYAKNCHHGVNIEEGSDGTNNPSDITEHFTLGDGTAGSFVTQNNDIGISLDGSGDGYKTITIQGWASTSDGIALNETNATPSDGVYVTLARVTSPRNAVANLNAGGASKTHLTDCAYHALGGAKVNAGTPAANGTWGTF